MKASIELGAIIVTAETPAELELLAGNRKRTANSRISFTDQEGAYLPASSHGVPTGLLIEFPHPCATCPHWQAHIDDERTDVIAAKDARGEIARQPHNCGRYLTNTKSCPFE